MRYRVWLALSMAAPLLLGASLPVPAGDGLDWLPGEARSRVSGARVRVDEIRAALDGKTFVERVSGLVEAGGTDPVPLLPEPGAEDVAMAAGLPAPLGQAVAGLTAAAREALRVLGPVGREDLQRMIAETHGAPPGLPGPGPSPDHPARAPVPELPPPGSPPQAAERLARALPGAALLMAAALDRYLPLLDVPAGPLPIRPAGNGCDLVNEVPLLCVGSPLESTYTDDAVLLIDLGGDDTYLNSAGGAAFLDQDTSAFVPLSVNIDRRGNDRYLPSRPLAPGFNVALGAGAGFAGLGMLVDVEGDDTYATPALLAEGRDAAATLVQGAGWTVGLGALFDLAGDDRYEVEAGDGDRGDVTLFGQGAGAGFLQAAIGALADLGGGDDHYAMRGGRVEGADIGPYLDTRWPVRWVLGQGFGNPGVGVLYDDGGRDSFHLSASARWLPGEEELPGSENYPNPQQRYPKHPGVRLAGQGYAAGPIVLGFVGTGVLLTGEGDTTYASEVTSEGLAFNGATVQGFGVLGGLGAVDDRGGDDEYAVRGSLTWDHTFFVDDSCVDEDGSSPCASAHAHADASSYGDNQMLFGQGLGVIAGLGLVEDHGGDDRYASETMERVRIELRDERTAPAGPPELEVTGHGSSWNWGQGVGQNEGYGALIDHGGGDEYAVRSVRETEARATSPDAPAEVVALSPYRADVVAQGAALGPHAVGALLDLGGTGDRFDVVTENPVSTSPDPDGALQRGFSWPLAQGAAAAGAQEAAPTGVFLATGQGAQLSMSPARPVCALSPGLRGYGTWLECPVSGSDPEHQPPDWSTRFGAAFGRAGEPGGQAPTLEVLPDAPDAARLGDRIEVGASLLEPDGTPVSGERVRFTLQAARPGGSLWYSGWEASGVTDVDGVARARLPVEDMSRWRIFLDSYEFRILAGYDGRPGVHPRWAARPIAVLP